MGISQEVLAYNDYSPRDINDQLEFLMVEKKKELSPVLCRKIWKHNQDRESEFYISSAKFVSEMPLSQCHEILGETGGIARDEVLETARELFGEW